MIDESLVIWQDTIIPAVRLQSGFLGVTLLIDRERDIGSSISLWDSLENLEAAEANGFIAQQTARLSGCLTGPIERHVYEAPVSFAPSLATAK
jgi:hypothetical protein